MSFGSFLKKAGHAVGEVGKYAAPVLALGGVTAPLAGVIGAGSAALSKATSGNSGGVKGVLGDAAKYGAADYAGAKLVGGLKNRLLPPPPGGTGMKVGPGGVKYPDPDSLTMINKAADVGGGGRFGGLMDRVKQITGLGAPGGLDARDVIGLGLGAVGMKQAHDAGQKGDAIADERLALARRQIADAEPIRQRANAELMSSMDRLGGKMLAPPDLSFLQDNMNPFRKKFSPAIQMGS